MNASEIINLAKKAYKRMGTTKGVAMAAIGGGYSGYLNGSFMQSNEMMKMAQDNMASQGNGGNLNGNIYWSDIAETGSTIATAFTMPATGTVVTAFRNGMVLQGIPTPLPSKASKISDHAFERTETVKDLLPGATEKLTKERAMERISQILQ